ncbi:glycoside hydrolase family 32 protein [Lederbergia wuyishanensis]|uniref:Fructan beta-fructosidase n=1 Tax=Lederbergia wuyishanensis TaxID=1347903 RepID=A0ABU0D8U5_9BACI|nr:glycoside hydrolase family 32 protein [Lederbergia wuyishanensis]MCJ8007574.1 glycoside hydrolase family 32 protein [Lederbergia wuyishanensis]MDQ0344843.1 fructan beta-fructosidase [Lederbergia wuyishanensis]
MYREKWRPQLHFSPKEKWMNDPNGLVYHDGEYHLFFQHHPHSKVWGPMHWGQAVSTDLLHWEELPIALYPDDLGQIFSGSAVVDKHNTSGLKNSNEDVMVAIFTHHGEDNEKQSIAYSNDRGRTWTKYEGNPVISNPGLKDFRDPKVFWHKKSNKWIMSLACGNHIRFYHSPNLLDWSYLSSFGEEYGSHRGVWECPDLIELSVEGCDEKKWGLIVSVNPGGPNGGSAVQYFVGDFNGESFTCEDDKKMVKWADFGRDFYAAVTWSNIDEPIWIGWMSNWQYANEVPTDPFRSAMSIPRKLSLRNQDNTYILVQNPIDLKSLLGETIAHYEKVTVQPGIAKNLNVSIPLHIKGEVKEFDRETSSLKVTLIGEKDEVEILFDRKSSELNIDRRKSGNVSFSEEFPSVDTMPLQEIYDFEIIIDCASIEIFLNGGSSVMTEILFPNEDYTSLQVSVKDGNATLKNVSVYKLNSIW